MRSRTIQPRKQTPSLSGAWLALQIAVLVTPAQLTSAAVEIDPDADLSNPANFMFVSDREDKLIDIVDLTKRKTVYRIETDYVVDHVIATPYAPLLVFFNIENHIATFFDLRSKEVFNEITLPIAPRHAILNTTGTKIGISDSQDGGFVLLSAYTQKILFNIEDFPPTGDVLFDPGEVDIYYSNNANGSLGLIDENTQRTWEMKLTGEESADLSSPSRSLDGSKIYVANNRTGQIYNLNAYSRNIYNTFEVGASPVRPYTTPEGIFLYMMDRESGRFQSLDQHQFEPYIDTYIDEGIDLVTVGRFDRMNLFLSSENPRYHIFDNTAKKVVTSGELKATPIGSQGSVDGRTTYVAFADIAEIAAIDLENFEIEYISATENGAGAYGIGLSNNVCH
jgi:hypothetical protein